MAIDWRVPELRREAFQRFYSWQLHYKAHPGCVYSLLPAIADAHDADLDQRAWLAWLNGNTQNPATTLLLFEAAPRPELWPRAVELWNDRWADLEWDTDRRYQKGKFGEATEDLMSSAFVEGYGLGQVVLAQTAEGWSTAWRWALSLPHLGRLSAWSYLEFNRILLGDVVPDAADFILRDKSGSRSHRNGLAVVAGHDAWSWPADGPDQLGLVPQLEELAEELLQEAWDRNIHHPDVTRLSLESALCTYKSWHKPNRRYTGVYADMAYDRIKKAEGRFGDRFQVLWDARARDLPDYMRPELPGVAVPLNAAKQNYYRETGTPPVLWREWPDMDPAPW